MTAAVLLALAAQVVTLRPADLETKAIYVRVGVGVESRLTLPDVAVRVRGQQSAKELLGLRLGQVRPKGVLLLRPREAGTARVVFEGATHHIRLDIEASTLGAAQDVDFRIGEPLTSSATPAPASPTPAPTPKTASAVLTPQPKREPVATPRKPEPQPTPATTARTSRAGDRESVPQDAGPAVSKPQTTTGATAVAASPTPAPTAPPSPVVTTLPAVARATDEHGAAPDSTPRPDATPSAPAGAKRQVAKIGRYIGMPGQRGVWIDELIRDDARVSLRVRIEDGAGAVEVKSLDIEGVPATVRTEVAGKDLVVIGEVPLPAQKPRQATLAMTERGRFRKEKLKLVGPGLADLVFDGGRVW